MKKKSIGFGFADVILISGISVMISALIYMVLNLYRADSIIRSWIPLMASGLSLAFISIFMRPRLLLGEKKRLRLKN